ncbi:MAG: 3-deoxy-D-manno-octulosonic acid transferase [Bacteroidales bacterium]|nr:3-deoxy-D-manno-octulosonic acid transferase [Bacteroidales bacterium]
MFFLYNILIYCYHLLIRIFGLFNDKARLWLRGRKDVFFRLSERIDPNVDIAWFHAASLGEFEQGRPVIEAFRQKFPQFKILLTFFSPSGYEVRKDYKGADYIFYLPIDTISNARKFIHIVNPKLAIFIKYEFWFNYLYELHKNNIPTFIISAIFRKEQHFFKWYGGWFRKMLKSINWFFVQNKDSFELLDSIGIKDASVSGDSRFDRVFAIAQQAKKFSLIEKFINNKKVFLGGSTWQPDEKLIEYLADKYKDNLKFIIAPHEINKERKKSIITAFNKHKVLKYSQADKVNIQNADILIIDGMGFLSSLYQYCDLAYIGGGFGKGIHNILEAVTFGKPVIFGPNYQKFDEAKELVRLKGAFNISNKKELLEITDNLIRNKTAYQSSSKICKNYVMDKKGATEIIIRKIIELI